MEVLFFIASCVMNVVMLILCVHFHNQSERYRYQSDSYMDRCDFWFFKAMSLTKTIKEERQAKKSLINQCKEWARKARARA